MMLETQRLINTMETTQASVLKKKKRKTTPLMINAQDKNTLVEELVRAINMKISVRSLQKKQS